MLIGFICPKRDSVDLSFKIKRILKKIKAKHINEWETTFTNNFILKVFLFSFMDIPDFFFKENLIIDGWLFENDSSLSLEETPGNFRAISIDSKKKKIYLYTDRFASRPFYYCLPQEDTLLFSSNMKLLVPFSKYGEISNKAISSLLFLGYLIDRYTLFDDILFLPSGSTITVEVNQGKLKLNFHNYYHVNDHDEIEIGYEEAKQYLKELFFAAAQRTFSKKTKQLFSLSGGLDSRIVTYLGLQNIPKNQITTYTFGWRKSLDVKIAFLVKDFFQLEHVFFDLPPLEVLKTYVDEAIEYNDGLVIWSGSIAGIPFFKNFVSSNNYSFCHTGQSGDFIFGSFLKASRIQLDPKIIEKEIIKRHVSNYTFWKILKRELPELWVTFKKILSKSVEELMNIGNVKNAEKLLENWNLLNRQERAIFNGYRAIEHFLKFSSIFYDYKLFNFAFFLPIKYRLKERIYIDTLMELLPKELLCIPWEKTGAPLSSSFLKRKGLFLWRKAAPAVLRRLFPKKISGYSMTPFKYLVVNDQNFLKELRSLIELQNYPTFKILKQNSKVLEQLLETTHGDIVLFRLYHIFKLFQKIKSWKNIIY